jgi:hypothetical protein
MLRATYNAQLWAINAMNRAFNILGMSLQPRGPLPNDGTSVRLGDPPLSSLL